MRRRLYLDNPYATFIIPIDDNDLCHVETREGTNILTVNEVVERFNRLPVVQTYGIIQSCIIDLDTGERQHFRTSWNSLLEKRERERERSSNLLRERLDLLK